MFSSPQMHAMTSACFYRVHVHVFVELCARLYLFVLCFLGENIVGYGEPSARQIKCQKKQLALILLGHWYSVNKHGPFLEDSNVVLVGQRLNVRC